jgi:hypothetical protein
MNRSSLSDSLQFDQSNVSRYVSKCSVSHSLEIRKLKIQDNKSVESGVELL